jgi:hypothetical protein
MPSLLRQPREHWRQGLPQHEGTRQGRLAACLRQLVGRQAGRQASEPCTSKQAAACMSARTATAQCRARAHGPGLAVLIWRHLYSSLLLVSSSCRSFSACARPVSCVAVAYAQRAMPSHQAWLLARVRVCVCEAPGMLEHAGSPCCLATHRPRAPCPQTGRTCRRTRSACGQTLRRGRCPPRRAPPKTQPPAQRTAWCRRHTPRRTLVINASVLLLLL